MTRHRQTHSALGPGKHRRASSALTLLCHGYAPGREQPVQRHRGTLSHKRAEETP
ncbi:MAG: hypothetical protein OJF61_001511 [Rhodanobacteraceae bacterium]|nr:MAG: hypothetical protein OJF61_001511 [Rhodanobacteraceae bacterium]